MVKPLTALANAKPRKANGDLEDNLLIYNKKTFVSRVAASKQPHEKHEEPQVAQGNLSKPLSNGPEIAPFDLGIQGLRFWQQQTQQPSLHAE